MRTPHWTFGKNFDGTGAFGRAYVTADELPPGAAGLQLQTRLNGKTVQSTSTSELIFDVAALVSMVSVGITLEIAERDQPNLIAIVGTTSPTPRRGSQALANVQDARDSNIDLSPARTIAVAHFFASLDVPYRCLIVQGNGFSETQLPESRDADLPTLGAVGAAQLECDYVSECSIRIVLRQATLLQGSPDRQLR